ncbi:MAG: SCO family protein [Bacteroidetes bacterium]|nr:SCO family protein [Bacteroidota bacterium]
MINFNFQKYLLASFVFLLLLFSGCKSKFELDENLRGFSFKLLDQDGQTVDFPTDFENKVVVVGFVFTHCPDICPLTVNNMQLVQNELTGKGETDDVVFVAISFDPARDTVPLLKKFAALREINEKNFRFLTGDRKITDSLMSTMRIVAVPEDSTIVDGTLSYFFTHTDRISLIDKKGFLRKEYSGSKANTSEIVVDIEKLR